MGVYGITTTSDTAVVSQLVASDDCLLKKVTIKGSAGALVRGQVLAMNTSTYLWEPFAASGSTGVEVARAILAEDVANSASTQVAQAYCQGKFFTADVIWPNGTTAAQEKAAVLSLMDKGIHVDQVIDTLPGSTTTTTTTSTTTTTT